MNVQLKNVKNHPDMSQETDCFSASIYVDGKRIGEVRNDGQGGSHEYSWSDPTAGKQLEAWAQTQPAEFDKLDQIINNLLDRQDIIAQLKRLTKKQTLFRFPETEKGAWRTVKSPFDAKVKEHLVKKYGDRIQCIANEDLEAAVAYCIDHEPDGTEVDN